MLTAVLGAFLAGLGAGSAAGTPLARRARSPLRAYAGLEAALALHALLAPAVIVLLPRVLEALGPRLADGGPLFLLRLTGALAVVVPPAVLMGATLPCMVRALEPGVLSGSAVVGTLYGANTVGAACGALAGSFALLPLLGTRGTFAVAAGLNLAAAAGALAWSRGSEPLPGAEARHAGHPGAPPVRGGRLLLVAAAVSGLCGALWQIGWIRAATFAFGTSVYAIGLTLAVYILGLGAGPFLVRRRLRPDNGARLAAGAQSAAGLGALVILPLLGALPVGAAWLSAEWRARPISMLAAQLAVTAALVLLPATAHGAVLPALVAALLRRGGAAHAAAARVYAASTWGAVLGFVAAGLALLPRLGTRGTLILASLLACLLASALLACECPGPWRRPGALLAIAAPALAACLLAAVLPSWSAPVVSSGGFLYGPVYRPPGGDAGGAAAAMRRRGAIVFYEDAAEGLVTVRRGAAGILSLQINGKTEASTGGDMPTQVLAAHLPLLLHPEPRDVLVVGLASGITLGAALDFDVARVATLEIAPAVARAARLFDAASGAPLEDPRVRLVFDDARAHLLARPATYDVITSQPSNPWVAGVSNLFTEEFYRLVRRRLRPGGLFCQWLQAYRLDPEDFRGIVATFLAVFPEATLWEESAGGGDYFLVGGDAPVHFAPARLGRAPARVRDRLRRAGIEDPAELAARFVAGTQALRSFTRGARLLTDDDLYLETSAPLALFEETLPAQVAALRRLRQPPAAVLDPGAVRDPGFDTALAAAIREREMRLEIAATLSRADLAVLQDVRLAAGAELLRAGLAVEAIDALAAAAAAAPGSPTAHLLLGEAYRAAGLVEAAAVAYRQAIALDPGLAAAWNALGRLLARDHPAEARVALERAVAADPRLAEAHNNLGAVLLRQGEDEAAARAFDAAIEQDPSLAAAWANRGVALRSRGDLAAAESDYRRALDLDPLATDARYNLAVVLATTGRRDEAARTLEALLEIDPTDDGAARALRNLRAGRSIDAPM